MKAIVYEKFGPAEVLQLKEVAKPVPADHEVLVKIHASTVEKEDPMMRQSPGLNGLFRPACKTLGLYLAGEVESIGKAVTHFVPGDRVYGCSSMKVMGSNAEYVCVPEKEALVPIPDGMSYEDAAALINGMLTAIPFLREAGRVTAGMRVLVNGASGSVGTAAVQAARAMGARVDGVCGGRNIELVKSLGAEVVIDYTREDFTKGGRKYDVVFDAAGKSSYGHCVDLLAPGGAYMTTSPTLDMLVPGRAKFMATGLRPADKKRADLQYLNRMIEAGQVKAVIDRRYPLAETAEAHRYVEGGHKVGCVVLTVA